MIDVSKYFIVFIIIISIFIINGDNPTSVVKPYEGPDPGYILAESDGGLSNRLRVLASYMWIGIANWENAHLVFIWDITSACPGHFLQVFQPMPTVIFATNSSRYVLDKNAKISFENSWAVLPWIMQMNNIPKSKFGQPSWSDIEYRMYSRFTPTQEIMNKVTTFVQKHNICEASAMHIRVTDLAVHMARKKKHINLESYFEFVESRPIDEPIYLLTDNPTTQSIFIEKYGRNKILLYSEIESEENQKPVVVSNQMRDNFRRLNIIKNENIIDDNVNNINGALNNGHIRGHGRGHRNNKKPHNTTLSEDHRFTTLEHTVIDIFIAAHSKTFKPAIYSSLSDLVKIFQNIGKKDRGWCT